MIYSATKFIKTGLILLCLWWNMRVVRVKYWWNHDMLRKAYCDIISIDNGTYPHTLYNPTFIAFLGRYLNFDWTDFMIEIKIKNTLL